MSSLALKGNSSHEVPEAAVGASLVMIAWSDPMCLQFIGLGYLSEKLFI